MAHRIIVHVDMDAFYASVEQLRRPELRNRPVIVGGAGRRGVVAAASYEARWFGVRSAMSSIEAQRRCPQAVFVAGDHAHYREISSRIMEILRRFTPLVEPLSLDEAFLDVTSTRRLFGEGPAVARRIRTSIRDEVGLWCSAGVATNKFLAKLASEHAKPTATADGPVPGAGVWVLEPDDELDFLHALPARAVWGVGPRTMDKLSRFGVETVGDLAAVPLDSLIRLLGRAVGTQLHDLAHARDDRPVDPEQEPKSISHEETFAHDRRDRDALERELLRMSDAVAGRLRAHEFVARTVSIKVRFGDFRTLSRSLTLSEPTDSAATVHSTSKSLLSEIDVGVGVRLLGVGVSGLVRDEHRQLSLDDLAVDRPSAEHGTGRRDAERAVDEIRARFGTTAIGPAALLDPGDGLRTRSSSERPWG